MDVIECSAGGSAAKCAIGWAMGLFLRGVEVSQITASDCGAQLELDLRRTKPVVRSSLRCESARNILETKLRTDHAQCMLPGMPPSIEMTCPLIESASQNNTVCAAMS